MSKFKQGDRVRVNGVGGPRGKVVDSSKNGQLVDVQLDNGLRHAVLTRMLIHDSPIKVGRLVEHVDGKFDGAKRVSHVATFNKGRGEDNRQAFVGKRWWPLSELRALEIEDLYGPREPETLTLQVKFDNPGAASGATGMLSAVEAALEEFGVTGFTIEVVDND